MAESNWQPILWLLEGNKEAIELRDGVIYRISDPLTEPQHVPPLPTPPQAEGGE